MKEILGCFVTSQFVHQTSPDDRQGTEKNIARMHTTLVRGNDGRFRRVPYITANSVRGKLRRFAAERVLKALNVPVSREMYSVLMSGRSSRQDIGGTPTVAAIQTSAHNPCAGLFGGGGFMLESRYAVQQMMPMLGWHDHLIHPALAAHAIPASELHVTPDDPAKDAYEVHLLHRVILTGKEDVLRGRGGEYIRDYAKSFAEWADEVFGSREAKKASKVAKAAGEAVVVTKSVDLAGFNLVEAMIPGLPLNFQIRFGEHVTDAQIGLMLLAVQDFCNANVLGGASARGFGSFVVTSLALHDSDGEAVNVFRPNDRTPGSYEVDVLKPEMQRYIDAATAGLAKMTLADLEVVFPSRAKIVQPSSPSDAIAA